MTAIRFKKSLRRAWKWPVYLLMGILTFVAFFPAVFTVAVSFMGGSEIVDSFYRVGRQMNFHIIPDQATLKGYLDVFLLTPNYLVKFWSSVFITVTIVAGQVVISCLGAYGFSKFNFFLKDTIFYLLIVLMMMPFQVTLVPNYIVLDWMGLIGGYAAVILPGMFSPFGVCLLTQVFSSMPDEVIEAAKVDGASHLQILFRVVIPHAKTGIASLVILVFIDNWNMVEQPLVFLKNSLMYPLSVFLSRIDTMEPERVFVCAVMAMAPVVLLFLHLKDAMIQGIEYSNMK
jgi:multiple sugar transport system permease protein